MATSLQGNLTKKAHQRVKFTEEQISELNKCMDPKNGPLYFMTNYSMIQHPTKGSMKFEMYDYQKRLVGTYHDNRFAIAMLPRQTGKTTCAAAYLVWYAMFVPDSQILIAAHKFAGAQDIMNRVRFVFSAFSSCLFLAQTKYAANRAIGPPFNNISIRLSYIRTPQVLIPPITITWVAAACFTHIIFFYY